MLHIIYSDESQPFVAFRGAHQRWWQLRTQTLQLYEKPEPITAEPETDAVGICFWCDERY